MKYAVNHPYIFDNYELAYMVSWFQATSVIWVEISNVCVICVALYPIEIIFNFISVAVIAEFDNYVYESMRNECFKKILEEDEIYEDIFIKHHTTSVRCKPEENST